jgi:Raf kinase inhibitor-like YbhB/YbcL family protein
MNRMKRVRMAGAGKLALVVMASAALASAASGWGGTLFAQAPAAPRAGGPPPPPPMTLMTPGWPDGGVIPPRFTQAGEQVSPELRWTNTPPGTVSFVLHMHDPDVARNRTTEDQAHWVVWNIPAASTGLPENVPKGAELPDGTRQISASGPVYRGPGAPATGPLHHYTFEIYALDTKLDVPPGTDAFATRVEVLKAMQGHVLGKAVYVGLFRRPS